MSSALLCCALCVVSAPVEIPRVLDERLQLELILQEPDIVTPTGLTIDAKGRILVIESHTHFRPDGYQGPPHDRILLIDPKETPAKPRVFFEGTKYTMNLARAPDDSVYVATRSEIFRLRDLDGDDRADKPEERTPIAHLETAGNYPHNGLSGFAFRPGDGKSFEVFFGFGENLGADYKLIGADGASLAGGGEGGNIYACAADGAKLRRIATGFWNPFHVTFDAQGRLFTVDNDPDSRPPCRLLHVVEGGDYGYRFRNGRKGTHPFTAWNGELPGTLPMVAGTGEAPCAVVAYDRRAVPDRDNLKLFPREYSGSLFVTSWGDHRIERYALKPRGASFTSVMEPVVVGDSSFRPVGMAADAEGSLYFTDWVDRSYPLHGKGRIWRLSATEPRTSWKEQEKSGYFEFTASDDSRQTADAVRHWTEAELDRGLEELAQRDDGEVLPDETLQRYQSRPDVLNRLTNNPKARHEYLQTLSADSNSRFRLHDPFLWQAVAASITKSLAGKRFNAEEAAKFLDRYARLENPQAAVWAAVAARDADAAHAVRLAPLLLKQGTTAARTLGALWIGELRLNEHKASLEAALAEPDASYQLIAVCFAALDALEAAQPTRDGGKSPVGERLAAALLYDDQANPTARRYALKLLPENHPALTTTKLKALLDDPDAEVAVEAVRTLRDRPDALESLLRAVDRRETPAAVRNEAIAALPIEPPESRKQLLTLIDGADVSAKTEALRVLRGGGKAAGGPPPESVAPADVRIYELEREGDPAAGERLFFHPRVASCYRCHEYEGRGASIGPALTTFGRGAARERILQSILDPNREIAPHYVPWIVTTADGRTLTGLYTGEDSDGTHRYADAQGKIFKLHPREIEAREAAKQSIMPGDFGRTLTDAELRDLAAFLQREAK